MNLQILPPGNSQIPALDAPAEDPLDLMEEIDALKKQKDVTILAHFYVDGDIQDIADFTGDRASFGSILRLNCRISSVWAGVFGGTG